MKSDLLLLNDNENALKLFSETPLFNWEPVVYRFLPKRRTIVEYYCKIKKPLVGSKIELEPIEISILYGQLYWILCSGIRIGFSIKLPKNLSFKVLGETLIVAPKLLEGSTNEVVIELSLPELQVITRDTTSMNVIVKNQSCYRGST